MKKFTSVLISVCLMVVIFASPASACADGPDNYRVVGVDSDDVLNVRSGPGRGYSIINSLPYNAQTVANKDQVPVHLCDGNANLNTFEKQNRWTKIVWEGDGRYVSGWVKSRFLAE